MTKRLKLLMMSKILMGHIACSDSTQSELVIPCFGQNEELLGVLDIDSDQPAFFTKQDADDLDQLMRKLFMGDIN